MDELSKLKVDAYDLITELEIVRKNLADLENKKAEVDLQISRLKEKKPFTIPTNVKDEDFKAKEAKIMAKRLEKIRNRKEEPEESEEQEEEEE